MFSKLDANNGFWQIPLFMSSWLPTTFITPSGWYCFNKLLFGISIKCAQTFPEAHEHDPYRTERGYMPGGRHYGIRATSSWAWHLSPGYTEKTRVRVSWSHTEQAKYEFRKISFKSLGHLIDQTGIQADPEKTLAIRTIKPTTALPELRRFSSVNSSLT